MVFRRMKQVAQQTKTKTSVPLKLRQERPICRNQNLIKFQAPAGRHIQKTIRRVLKMYRWRKMPLLTELGNYFCPGSTKMSRLRRCLFFRIFAFDTFLCKMVEALLNQFSNFPRRARSDRHISIAL